MRKSSSRKNATTAPNAQSVAMYSVMSQTATSVTIPAPGATTVEMRFASIEDRDNFFPGEWEHVTMSQQEAGWFTVDLGPLELSDGTYEYEFIIDGDEQFPVADPYAIEITRFGGYRGVMHIRDGIWVQPQFDWEDELDPTRHLPENHKLVIYQLPMRWTSTESDIQHRQVELGSFDKALFEHLDNIADTGFNAIELLPVQDSTDTINWGYGTRFFFTPDLDMGHPVELKIFIKRCHQRGIRVILDVVMNHAKKCPLESLAGEWFFIDTPAEEGREHDWGGKCFRFETPQPDDSFMAREFLYAMAQFWIKDYHIDGFRIDEFNGIKNYDFLQEFTERAWQMHTTFFPERPFIVIAEDSRRRSAITQPTHDNKNKGKLRPVVNAMWDFNQRDDLRRAVSNWINTNWGEPSRSQRLEAIILGNQSWDDYRRTFSEGFTDMTQRVVYLTSPEVEKNGEQRMINYLLRQELHNRGWSDTGFRNIQRVVDGYVDDHSNYRTPEAIESLNSAFERFRSANVLLMSTAGIPMMLAGEEFGDTHDTNPEDRRQKMSDVVNWERRGTPRHWQLEQQIGDLIELRKTHPALLRNETVFFYFHPTFDNNNGERVFAFCRTAGKPLFSTGQIVVVGNLSLRNYDNFILPWHWNAMQEHAVSMHGRMASFTSPQANIPFMPGQVRIFST